MKIILTWIKLKFCMFCLQIRLGDCKDSSCHVHVHDMHPHNRIGFSRGWGWTCQIPGRHMPDHRSSSSSSIDIGFSPRFRQQLCCPLVRTCFVPQGCDQMLDHTPSSTRWYNFPQWILTCESVRLSWKEPRSIAFLVSDDHQWQEKWPSYDQNEETKTPSNGTHRAQGVHRRVHFQGRWIDVRLSLAAPEWPWNRTVRGHVARGNGNASGHQHPCGQCDMHGRSQHWRDDNGRKAPHGTSSI